MTKVVLSLMAFAFPAFAIVAALVLWFAPQWLEDELYPGEEEPDQ